MKNRLGKVIALALPVFAAFMAFAANAFAAAPYHGIYYEPEMPESLKK